jgi:catechol 2,3-dioxygenase-like lactoylglutathione lyase family enzyme
LLDTLNSKKATCRFGLAGGKEFRGLALALVGASIGEKMKKEIDGFRLAVHVTVLGMISFVGSVGARSRVATPTVPDGREAQSVLGLQPRHATISVADLQLERDWFIEKLGFTMPSTPPMGGPNQKIQGVQLTTPGFQIHLIQFQGSQRTKIPGSPFLSQGWIHVAFTVSDTDKAFSFLQTAGTDVKGMKDKTGKMGTLVLHDPEGNEIELFSR